MGRGIGRGDGGEGGIALTEGKWWRNPPSRREIRGMRETAGVELPLEEDRCRKVQPTCERRMPVDSNDGWTGGSVDSTLTARSHCRPSRIPHHSSRHCKDPCPLSTTAGRSGSAAGGHS